MRYERRSIYVCYMHKQGQQCRRDYFKSIYSKYENLIPNSYFGFIFFKCLSVLFNLWFSYIYPVQESPWGMNVRHFLIFQRHRIPTVTGKSNLPLQIRKCNWFKKLFHSFLRNQYKHWLYTTGWLCRLSGAPQLVKREPNDGKWSIFVI